MVDISGFYNISSNAIRKAAESTSIQNASHSTGEFEGMLDKAIENLSTTNAYLSDAENEQIKWALGESENTHDLSIALGKASDRIKLYGSGTRQVFRSIQGNYADSDLRS